MSSPDILIIWLKSDSPNLSTSSIEMPVGVEASILLFVSVAIMSKSSLEFFVMFDYKLFWSFNQE